MNRVELDWNKLLGFDHCRSDGQREAPPSTAMQAAIGQPGGGGSALLLRTFNAMDSLALQLPRG